MCEITGENIPTNCITGKDHRHFLTDHRQCRGDLRADKAAADHHEMFLHICHGAQVLIIFKVAEINDVARAKWQMDR